MKYRHRARPIEGQPDLGPGKGFGKGFTLAEVLITLGIIGVVAALTLPSVISSFKEQRTITQLKKAYSVISQAMQRAQVDFGPYEHWEITNMTPIQYLETYWLPNFNVNKICTSSLVCGYKDTAPWKKYNGNSEYLAFMSPAWRVPFLTTDGILYSISIAGGVPGESEKLVILDINGSQGPNVFGEDVFMLIRTDNGQIRPLGYDKEESVIDADCTKSGKAHYCAAKIMKDGWKMESDYLK